LRKYNSIRIKYKKISRLSTEQGNSGESRIKLANLLTVNSSLPVIKKVPALRVEACNVEEKLGGNINLREENELANS